MPYKRGYQAGFTYAEKLTWSKKNDDEGWSPDSFSTAYAALKGRSSTVAPTNPSFSANCLAAVYVADKPQGLKPCDPGGTWRHRWSDAL